MATGQHSCRRKKYRNDYTQKKISPLNNSIDNTPKRFMANPLNAIIKTTAKP
jgi:hypothetical protein